MTRRVLAAARRLGPGLKLHAEPYTRTGAARLGVLLGATSVDHLEQGSEEDIQALASARTITTLLPGTAFFTGGRFPPARRLIDAGAAVALATDFNPGTSPTPSMQMILALACTQMRMTSAEALATATINGAAALGRADSLGSLEPGELADIIVLDAGDYREAAYYFGVNLCARVMKRGRWIWPQEENP